MSCRWHSRCVGAVSAVALGTAVERGGTTTSAPRPGPAPLGAVLLAQPLARAVELQPRAVDQQVHGAGIAAGAATRTVAARLRPRHLQRLGPAAQGGGVRAVWSGTARSSPSRPMTEPISPSVCRYASRNTA